ncbi:MAG: DUF4145 domain-containing protein [Bacteroides sp.]|nr:DUF4145 domain-containing protein [Bacteroides sp.]
MEIQEFVSRIDDFIGMSSSEVIPYFGYFLTKFESNVSFTAKDIEECFIKLHIPKYSNISAYLSRAVKKKIFVRNKLGGYNISLTESKRIDEILKIPRNVVPSENLFPLELFNNTRDYLKKTAKQAIICYDMGAYDACLVMIRRLIETLIIELFEKQAIADRIKNPQGNYMFCGDLIDELLKEKRLWTIGRNTVQVLPSIKTKGDLSAHNRRFNAKKSDIDQLKDGLRITIEELIHLIDYSHS